MGNEMSTALLQQLFDALSDKNRRSMEENGKTLSVNATILARGWIYGIELEELLLETDSRTSHLDLEGLTAQFDLPWRTVFQRPRYLSAGAFGHNALTIADAACFLIRMEEMGFDSHPDRLIAHGLQNQNGFTHVTASEWTLLAYPKRRHKELFTARSDLPIDDGEWHTKVWKDPIGRRIEFTLMGEQPYELVVRGPRYRKPKPQVRTKFGVCGYSYTKGDPESAIAHRSEHARVMRFMDPRPLRAFAQRLVSHADPELVTRLSPMWMHREIHQRARQFKHELQFSFRQWEGSSKSKNLHPESHGYLFADHTETPGQGTAVGACAFWCDQGNWRLRWVWVCPKMRRPGVLEHRWAQFVSRYGNFEIETPLSDGIHAFVLKHGTTEQRKRLTLPQHVQTA